ncbi:MAG: Vitamin B12 dependent methionine synthase activation subunit [Ruminococcaceae bacterium]|nr:Vitamin B12 dependent methionine synthase activation subunit [Oscillospiraceae bacterium]
MSVTLLAFDANDLRVSMSDAMRYMGVSGDAPDVKTIAENLLPELCYAAKPKVCFRELEMVFDGDRLNVGGIRTNSEALMKNLEGCASAYVFAATLGVGTDRLISRYSKLETSKAVILGALGSAMIESLCDEVCAVLEREQQSIGNFIKPRFSPGYGGFELTAQREIADILETEKRIGLYFTDSLMMIPEKSVTAVVGIYKK